MIVFNKQHFCKKLMVSYLKEGLESSFQCIWEMLCIASLSCTVTMHSPFLRDLSEKSCSKGAFSILLWCVVIKLRTHVPWDIHEHLAKLAYEEHSL